MRMSATVSPVVQPEHPATIHALVIDDDPCVRQMIVDYLGDNDMRVTALPDGRQVEAVLRQEIIDVLILDLKLPGEDGMQVARRVRDGSNVPMIMLTARIEEADRVMGLELGADDYLTKPFSPRELLARIRALLRRARAQETVAQGMARVRAYRFAGWELNVRLRRLTAPDGSLLALTNAEFHLLGAFLAAPQRILSREQLLDLSRLHSAEVYDRAVDVQVGRLRKKLEGACPDATIIRTERGAGYMLAAEVEVVR
jgi:two-component system OmpR family response regulator